MRIAYRSPDGTPTSRLHRRRPYTILKLLRLVENMASSEHIFCIPYIRHHPKAKANACQTRPVSTAYCPICSAYLYWSRRLIRAILDKIYTGQHDLSHNRGRRSASVQFRFSILMRSFRSTQCESNIESSFSPSQWSPSTNVLWNLTFCFRQKSVKYTFVRIPPSPERLSLSNEVSF